MVFFSDPFWEARVPCPGSIKYDWYHAVVRTTFGGAALCCGNTASQMTKTDAGMALQINTCLPYSSYGKNSNSLT